MGEVKKKKKSASVFFLGIAKFSSRRAVLVCIQTSNVLSYFKISTNVIGETWYLSINLNFLEILLMQMDKGSWREAQMGRQDLHKEIKWNLGVP